VQADPHAESGERLCELLHARSHGPALPEVEPIFQIDTVSARVLRDDQDFLHARADQTLGFAEHVADGPAREITPHRRDDAEAAAVIAALGDLEVRVMTRRQSNPLRRHEIDERVVLRRQVLMHR
jgi:hypothetical protein